MIRTLSVDPRKWAEFGLNCKKNGVSMSEVLVGAIDDYNKKQKEKENERKRD